MKHFLASAYNDWGTVYADEVIKASSFRTAMGRAAQLAKEKSRKNHVKELSIKLKHIGTEKKIDE